jgi:putative hydrolase of the HAD superfamily
MQDSDRSTHCVASTAILFDAVGTLIYADPAPAVVYEAIGRRFGSTLTVEEIATRFRAAFGAEEARDREVGGGQTSEQRERRRWQTIVAAVFAELPDTASLFDELWRHFARPDAWRPYDDASPAVSQLIDAGHIVGVASNFDARLLPIVAAHFPQIAPDRVFVSSQVGHRKPAREFFAAVERALPVSPRAEPTLVGDDVDSDFRGAQRAGWNAIFVDREARHRGLAPTVQSLGQIAGLLSANPRNRAATE